MLYLAAVLIAVALSLLWVASRRRRDLGLPAGRVIYVDTSGWGKVETPLYDAELGLVGKPDYLVETAGQVIPVEVKSTHISSAPYDAHVFQLAAYCLLVQRHYGKRPSYGILHYPNRTFAVDNTPELEAELLSLLDEIHAQEKSGEPRRSHESPARCSRCGYRQTCDQRLL